MAYAGNLLPSHAAATVSHSQPHAATCSHLQPLPGTHNHTQPLAATRSPSSGRKWPQVTAAVKWPQVAASGCFRQVAASGRKWPLFPISNSTPNATPLIFPTLLILLFSKLFFFLFFFFFCFSSFASSALLSMSKKDIFAYEIEIIRNALSSLELTCATFGSDQISNQQMLSWGTKAQFRRLHQMSLHRLLQGLVRPGKWHTGDAGSEYSTEKLFKQSMPPQVWNDDFGSK